MSLSIFMYKCRKVLSIVESNCAFEGVEQLYCFDELFCNIFEGFTRLVGLLPRIFILTKEFRKQMLHCSKAFDRRYIFKSGCFIANERCLKFELFLRHFRRGILLKKTAHIMLLTAQSSFNRLQLPSHGISGNELLLPAQASV